MLHPYRNISTYLEHIFISVRIRTKNAQLRLNINTQKMYMNARNTDGRHYMHTKLLTQVLHNLASQSGVKYIKANARKTLFHRSSYVIAKLF